MLPGQRPAPPPGRFRPSGTGGKGHGRRVGALLALSLALMLLVLTPALVLAKEAWAQGPRYFHLATGPSSGVEFSFGTTLAGALTTPEGSRPCDRGGSCGVPGLIASAITTAGGDENLGLLRRGECEGAILSAHLAASAYLGTGPYLRQQPFTGLRAVAHLYTEMLHVLVPALAPVVSIQDLNGRRLVLGERAATADSILPLLLKGAGLAEKSYRPVFLRTAGAVDALANGDVDALVVFSGTPAQMITEAALRTPVRLLPLTLRDRAAVRELHPFLMPTEITAGAYPTVPGTPTLGMAALLVVREDLPEPLVHALTASLWHPVTHEIATAAHPPTHSLERAQAQVSIPIPLHPGALRWYQENETVPDPSRSTPRPAKSPNE